MQQEEVLNRINNIFKDIFDDENIKLSASTTAANIEGWDSLNHINIMGAIQKEFKIRFDLKEIASFRSVGDIVSAVMSKKIQ